MRKPPRTCPICKKRVHRRDPEFPFCSERCRLRDLGNWASGRYRVSTPLPATDESESDAATIPTAEHEEK